MLKVFEDGLGLIIKDTVKLDKLYRDEANIWKSILIE